MKKKRSTDQILAEYRLNMLRMELAILVKKYAKVLNLKVEDVK